MIANHKGEIPIVLLLLPFLSGIGAGLILPSPGNLNWFIVLCCLLAFVFITLNLAYSRLKLYKIRWAGGALITGILFLFGLISVIVHNELNNKNHFSKTPAPYLVVKINNEPVLKNGWLRFTARVEESINNHKTSSVSGNLLISIKDTAANKLQYGDELLIPANYNFVDPPFNPAEFNYKKYLADQNIHYQQFLYNGQYMVLAHNAGNPFIAWSMQLRRHLVEKLKTDMHDRNAIAVASTLLLGYKAELNTDVLQAYSTTGTVYVLSVSGAQVAIIYLVLTFTLGFLDRHKYGRLLKAIIIIGVLWYYALLTGLSPAVCRAVLMVSFIVIGKTYNRYINSLNILAIAAFVLLLYDPYAVTEVGFQLSFIAITGLILFRPIVYKWLKFKNKWADKFWALCSVSIAAQVVIFPLSALYFHQFPVYFLISNLLVFIPATVIMYTGLVYLLLPQIPVISQLLAYILEQTILLMNKMLAIIERLPLASVNKLWISTTELLLLYAIVISLFYFLYERRSRLLKACLYSMLLVSICISINKFNMLRSDSLAFLSLRKHVGLVMRHGDKAVVISDLADTDKNYQYSILPYLDSCGISHAEVYNLKQDIRSPFLIKKDNLIQFMHNKIFIFSNGLINKHLINMPQINYLYITNNACLTSSVVNDFNCRMLVIDGTNSDAVIRSIAGAAKLARRNYTILKRNNSLLVVSN